MADAAMASEIERVEQIEIVDSLSVDSLSFFEAYRLSPQAGRILPPDALCEGMNTYIVTLPGMWLRSVAHQPRPDASSMASFKA